MSDAANQSDVVLTDKITSEEEWHDKQSKRGEMKGYKKGKMIHKETYTSTNEE